MNGITWKHVAVITLGGAVAVVGALPFVAASAATALIAGGFGIATGALGHAQGANKKGKQEP